MKTEDSNLIYSPITTLLDVVLGTNDDLILQIGYAGKRFKITIEPQEKGGE